MLFVVKIVFLPMYSSFIVFLVHVSVGSDVPLWWPLIDILNVPDDIIDEKSVAVLYG